MGGNRGRTTFAKLQRERARMEKQRLKREARLEREPSTEVIDVENLKVDPETGRILPGQLPADYYEQLEDELEDAEP
jgi:hypothetical protein